MAAQRGWLLRNADGSVAVREWWNGYSTLLDLTNPQAYGWLRATLEERRTEDGVDGFKFDAGDLLHYRDDDLTAAGGGGFAQSEAWARLAAEFEINELRACWKSAGQPLAQRLQDKPQRWGAEGLESLIPESIAQGLLGFAFNCPDMIGGGEVGDADSGTGLDQELFVRFAQCSALFPMMQFSIAPWRVLDGRHLTAVKDAVAVRERFLPDIELLVQHAADTGEPILRPLAYSHAGYEEVHDQFLLGDRILVAPVLERGATERTVRIPPGTWSRDGDRVAGPTELTVSVELESLPVWVREDAQ
jgi:alpha-glucosidase (family GH31 glycosyl hydrolase)